MGQYCSSSYRQPVADHGAAAAAAAADGFMRKQQQQQPEMEKKAAAAAAPPRRSRKAMRHAYDASSHGDLVLVVSLDSITKIG
uniref:Uncharacterized protein n=1 Tax=Oryza glumipatula TaxID=40148 RepID=A0A0E0BT81_9ORYZ